VSSDHRPAERLTAALSGVVAVTVAPFREGTGRVDPAVSAAVVARMADAGIPAVTALGNTAEVYQLSDAERRQLLVAARDGAGPAVTLAGLAGSVHDVLGTAALAADLGYDAVMLHEPVDPLTDSCGIELFWNSVLDRLPLPAVLYVRSGRVGESSLRRLADRPEVAGVKYAAPDRELLRRLAGSADCTWINGSAEGRVQETVAFGVRGFTSGLANVRPDLALAVHRAALSGHADRLDAALAPVLPFEQLRNEHGGRLNVSVVKQALIAIGFPVGGVRPPAVTATPAQLAAVLRRFPADPVERLRADAG
jgi:4-hydroxy-tetrahydrodipicolinate synthase